MYRGKLAAMRSVVAMLFDRKRLVRLLLVVEKCIADSQDWKDGQ
jgi:hypothetical protein